MRQSFLAGALLVAACGRVSGDADQAVLPDAAADAGVDSSDASPTSFRVRWALQSHGYAVPNDLVLAPTGDVFVTGSFAYTIDFGSGPATAGLTLSPYVARVSADGEPRSLAWDGGDCGRIPSGATTTSDSVWSLVTAWKGPGLGCMGGEEYVSLNRYSLDGHLSGLPTSIVTVPVAADPILLGTSGSVAITLDDRSLVVLGGWTGSAAFPDGTFEAKDHREWSAGLSPDGTLRWVRRGDVDAHQTKILAATPTDGGYVVSGEFAGTVDLGAGPMTAVGAWNLFLASYASNGTIRWSRGYDGAGLIQNESVRLARASGGELIASTVAQGVVTLGPTPLTPRGLDGLVIRFSPTGEVLAATLVGGDGDDDLEGMTVDDAGNVFLGGAVEYTQHAAIDGEHPIMTSRAAIIGLSPAFVETSRWVSPPLPAYDPARPDAAWAYLLAMRGGNLFVAGWFTGDLTIGATTLSAGPAGPYGAPDKRTFIASFAP